MQMVGIPRDPIGPVSISMVAGINGWPVLTTSALRQAKEAQLTSNLLAQLFDSLK